MAGFILAGGRSRRMGRDKALLRYGDRALVLHIAEEVKAAAGSVALIAPEGSYGELAIPVIPDAFPAWGPLGGIVTALRQGSEFNLITACDMPGLTRHWLRELLDRARSDVTVAITTRRHPLCAVYRDSALPILEGAIERGVHRVLDALELLQVDEVPMPCSVCANVNTPEEWAAVRS